MAFPPYRFLVIKMFFFFFILFAIEMMNFDLLFVKMATVRKDVKQKDDGT